MSDDGVYVVGQSGSTAYLWSELTGLEALPQTVVDYRTSNAYRISSGGDYAVGVQFFEIPGGAFQAVGTRWTLGGGVDEIGANVPGAIRYTPLDVSHDGQTVVGSAFDPETDDGFACTWTLEGGIARIPPSTDGLDPTGAIAVSADGTAVLFSSYVEGASIPGLWDPWRGSTALADRIAEAGIDPGEWEIIDALALSGDGTTIVGSASGPTGRRGYVIHLPEPGGRPLAYLIAAAFSVARIRRRVRS